MTQVRSDYRHLSQLTILFWHITVLKGFEVKQVKPLVGLRTNLK